MSEPVQNSKSDAEPDLQPWVKPTLSTVPMKEAMTLGGRFGRPQTIVIYS